MAADLNQTLKSFWGSEHSKAIITIAELHKDCVCVECFFKFGLVRFRKCVEKAHYDLSALLVQYVFHFNLLRGKRTFIFNVVIIVLLV